MNQISYENQIERLNHLVNEMENIAGLADSLLLTRPAEGGWNILETVVHMNKAYAPHYRDHLKKALEGSPEKEEAPTTFQGGRLARFLYQAMRPQEGKRKMKMKTLRKFQPGAGETESSAAVFRRFFTLQEDLKTRILEARNRDISGKKIPSAIGPLIRFAIPECFEFVIAHEERHVLQCQEILASIGALSELKGKDIF